MQRTGRSRKQLTCAIDGFLHELRIRRSRPILPPINIATTGVEQVELKSNNASDPEAESNIRPTNFENFQNLDSLH